MNQFLDHMSLLFAHPIENLRSHFSCLKCKQAVSSMQYDGNDQYKPIVRLSCESCHTCWNLCRECDYSRQSDFPKISMLRNPSVKEQNLQDQCDSHIHKYHSNTAMIDDNGFDTVDEHTQQQSQQSIAVQNLNVMVQDVYPASENMITNNHNTKIRECLFEKESHKKYVEHLIKKYWMKNENCSLKATDIVTFLNLVKLIAQSSRDENKELSSILTSLDSQRGAEYKQLFDHFRLLKEELGKVKSVLKVLKHILLANNVVQSIVDFDLVLSGIDKAVNPPEDHYVRPSDTQDDEPEITVNHPIVYKDMRKVLEGKYSFLSNIAVPPIHLHDSGYAYVLPSDILKMSVSLGTDIEIIQAGVPYTHDKPVRRSVYRSPRMNALVEDYSNMEDTLVVLFGLWSDGCYCGTESKGNRNTAKMTTIHICHPNITHDHVFPIAFGRSKDKDDDVKRIILADIEKLVNIPLKCYVPGMKKNMNVLFRIGYALQDRPEHSETTSFMSSGGTYSKRVNFSCPIEVSKNPNNRHHDSGNDSTNRCKLVKQLSSCQMCMSNRIDYFCNKELNRAASSNRRCTECYDWDMSIVEYTPPSLFPLDDIPASERNGIFLKSKIITFKTMEVSCRFMFKKIYLLEWRKTEASHYARRECINSSKFEELYQRAKSMRDEIGNGNADVPEFPEDLLSSFWNDKILPLDHYHLGIMHYLFLNVGGHLLDVVRNKLAQDNLWNGVHSKWNTILLDVRRLSISWCKGWTLGSKDCPGSMWVSENYLGFSLICKSLACSIQSVKKSASYCRLIEDTLMTYSSLVSTVMSPDVPTSDMKNSVESLSKLLLSFVEKLSYQSMKTGLNKIETASCFVNLLSLKDKMETFGVLRNYWEGGLKGEGIFLPLKKSINRGLHAKGVCKQVLLSQYQTLAMNQLVDFQKDIENYTSFIQEDLSSNSNDTDINDDEEEVPVIALDTKRYRKYYCYESMHHVNQQLEEYKPISIAWFVSNKQPFVFIGRKTRKKTMVLLNMHNVLHDVKATTVFQLECVGDPVQLESVSTIATDYISCLALPLVNCTPDGDGHDGIIETYYFIINEHHEEITRNNIFSYPTIMKREQSEMVENEILMNVFDVGSLSRQECQNCRDRSWCVGLKDRGVMLVPGATSGFVCGFRYENNIVNENYAVWTVKYYNDRGRNACVVKDMKYWELKEVIH